MPIKPRNTDLEFVAVINVPDPGAADADLTNFHGFKVPFEAEVTRVDHVPQAAWVAAAAANDGAVAIKRNNTGTAIATTAVTSALAAGSLNNIATLDGTTKFLAKGDNVTVDITANGTANAPAMNIVVRFRARQGK